MNHIDLDQAEEDIFNCDVTDETLEAAAGASANAQAGASLWSSFTPAGCTCVN